MYKLVFVVGLFLLLSACGERFSLFHIPEVAQSTSGTNENVVDFLNSNLTKNPNNTDIAIQKLRYLKKEGWTDDSRSFVEHYLRKDSLNFRIHELAADFYISRDMLGPALRRANTAEALGANSPAFYDMKAILFSRLGKYAEAIDYINKAILLNKSDYGAYYTKGKIYLTLKDTLSALKFMEVSLQQNSEDDDLLYEISGIYEGKKEYAKAMALIDKAIGQRPKRETLHLKKARIQYVSGAITESKATLLRAMNIDSSYMESGYALADMYFEQNLYDSTILISNQLIMRDSTALRPILMQARSFDKKFFYNNAVRNYAKVLAVDSTHAEAMVEMQKVKGKIAYLRKLKETRASMPVFDLVTPKKNN